MGTEESIKEIQTQFDESITMLANVFNKAEKDGGRYRLIIAKKLFKTPLWSLHM